MLVVVVCGFVNSKFVLCDDDASCLVEMTRSVIFIHVTSCHHMSDERQIDHRPAVTHPANRPAATHPATDSRTSLDDEQHDVFSLFS